MYNNINICQYVEIPLKLIYLTQFPRFEIVPSSMGLNIYILTHEMLRVKLTNKPQQGINTTFSSRPKKITTNILDPSLNTIQWSRTNFRRFVSFSANLVEIWQHDLLLKMQCPLLELQFTLKTPQLYNSNHSKLQFK